MSAAVRVNRVVTLMGSDNKYLKYPLSGVIEYAEFGTSGQIIWATFRAGAARNLSHPVVIKNFTVNYED